MRIRVLRALALSAALWVWVSAVPAAVGLPEVVVSSRPLHSLVAGLMLGAGEPRLLISGREAPWDYRPTAAQERLVERADLVVWSGAELEPEIDRLLQRATIAGEVFEVLSAAPIKVLPSRADDARRDPMFWLDTRNMLILLDAMGERLIALDPSRADLYRRNWRQLAARLGKIDRNLEFSYRDVSGMPVFFYHDTHQYFAQAYAMHLAGSVHTPGSNGAADTGEVLAMRSRMAAAGRTCLFTERALPEPKLDLLVMNADVPLVELDSFGVSLEPGPGLYAELMRRNFAAIAGCVKQVKPEDAGAVAAGPMPVPDIRAFPAQIQPRYVMRDQYGRTVSVEDFEGRLQVIYFGYTFCPDVCPTALAVLAQALRLLGDDAEQVQPIFITVDPARDTPELLGEYVKYFDPRMLALSASPEVTKRTAELFRARYEYVPSQSGDPERYAMDHTGSLFLLGRNGEFITKFAHGLAASDVAERLRDVLRDGGNG
jgi:protein SCO1/2